MEVTLIPSPTFKPASDEQKATFEAIRTRGRLERVAMSTALENIKHSGGMYAIAPAVNAPTPAEPRSVENMTVEELKLLMVTMGIAPEKGMKKSDVIRLVKEALDKIVVEEG